ncbi:MAG TPA: glycosyltransferase family 4 protein [Patescibacteria group bacterium]|nr:glycosyltransferase family 4 protein [Patescibacteria group bacterium]
MKKKILFLVPRLATGGAETLVWEYARSFSLSGWEIAVAAVVGRGDREEDFSRLGIKVQVSEGKSWKDWNKLVAFARDFQPDIIHSHVFSADVAGFLLQKKLPAKWISTQHNVGTAHSFCRRLVLAWILRQADKVVAVSVVVENFCRYGLHLSSKKVVRIDNGIDLLSWLGTSPALFQKGSVLSLVTIGRLEPQKNQELLLQALASWKHLDWKLTVYGVGQEEKKLKKLAEELGIAAKVIWAGVSKNLEEEISKYQVIIQPSRWEGMSLVVQEAMAAGRLVIASQAAAAGLLGDKKEGLVMSDLSIVALRSSLDYVIKNPEKAQALARTGQEKARAEFSLIKNQEKIIHLYHEV